MRRRPLQLTRQCSRQAGRPEFRSVSIADGAQRNVELCGRGLEGLQLICISAGGRRRLGQGA